MGNRRIHYGQTKEIALEVLGDPDLAEEIALADISIDREHPPGLNKDYWRHFDPLGWVPGRRDARVSIAEYYLDLAKKTGEVRYLGYGLHGLQDKAMHEYIPWEGRPWVWTKPSWRDSPKTNKAGARQAAAATKDYLLRFKS